MKILGSGGIKAQIEQFKKILKRIIGLSKKYGLHKHIKGFDIFKTTFDSIKEQINSDVLTHLTDEHIEQNPKKFMKFYYDIIQTEMSIFNDQCFKEIAVFLVKAPEFGLDPRVPKLKKQLECYQQRGREMSQILLKFKSILDVSMMIVKRNFKKL